MVTFRLILVATLVVVILGYLSILISGSAAKAYIDGFTGLEPNTNTFTLYYMNGCPHCETILPDYKNFAAAGQIVTNGKTTKIRMLEQGNPAAAPELEANHVKGFPTFILKRSAGDSIEYKGDRTIPAMKEIISANAS